MDSSLRVAALDHFLIWRYQRVAAQSKAPTLHFVRISIDIVPFFAQYEVPSHSHYLLVHQPDRWSNPPKGYFNLP